MFILMYIFVLSIIKNSFEMQVRGQKGWNVLMSSAGCWCSSAGQQSPPSVHFLATYCLYCSPSIQNMLSRPVKVSLFWYIKIKFTWTLNNLE